MTQPNVTAIIWGVTPPLDRSPYVPVLSPKPGLAVEGIILAPAMVTCYTHHFDRRTLPCQPNQERGCYWCSIRIPRRWKGWIVVLWGGKPRQGLLELTPESVRHCPALLERDGQLRGWRIRAWRANRARNAPVLASLERSPWPEESLPVPFDATEALYRIWSGETQCAK